MASGRRALAAERSTASPSVRTKCAPLTMASHMRPLPRAASSTAVRDLGVLDRNGKKLAAPSMIHKRALSTSIADAMNALLKGVISTEPRPTTPSNGRGSRQDRNDQ
jgi:hypothetical protein